MADIVGGNSERARNLARLVERLAKQLNDQLPQDLKFGIALWDPNGSVHAAVSDGVEMKDLVRALQDLSRQHGIGPSILAPPAGFKV